MQETVGNTQATTVLRHNLRTRINHIIGYAELLLEDVPEEGLAEESLKRILASAQQILAAVQKHSLAAPDESLPANALVLLRAEVETPVSVILKRIGELMNIETGSRLLDVERIRMAASELLLFDSLSRTEAASAGVLSFASPTPREGAAKLTGKLLVVDDSDPNREMLCRLLERQGHTCVALADGAEAIDRLRSERFDVVFLDMVMPGMSGLSVLEVIKTDESLATVAVVMLSALDEVREIGLALEMGAEDYLLVPFEAAILHARLNAILERQRFKNMERERTRQLEAADIELRRSNEELRRFASVVSHDLQEPLRMVTSYMQLLERDLGNNLTERQREFLNFAIDGGARMSALIQDLLAYSRVAARSPELELVDCTQIVNDIIGDLRTSIDESSAEVKWGHLPSVTADPSQLRQLFQNLLSNAIKYRSAHPPKIEIAAVRHGSDWLFHVSDNGIGIGKEYCDRVFEMFSRLHSRSTPGTGIGLAICQRVVERLGGRIWVESAPGEGSTFYFTVPVERSLSR